MLKLSIAEDTAKYLDFYSLERWCTFPTRLGFTKTRSFRSLPLDQNGRAPNYQTLPPTVHMAKFLQPIWSWQSPYCQLVALEASQHLTSQISLFLGGHPQVRYTRSTIDMGLVNHSTKNHQASPIPPRRFINLVVLLNKTQVLRLRIFFHSVNIFSTHVFY